MEIINHYKCGFCGEVYSEQEKCEKCEASHKKAVKVRGQEFAKDNIYPQTIMIEMEDGTIQAYYSGDSFDDY